MKRVLFLTYRMAKGFGVDVVVHNLDLALAKQGVQVFVACLDTDGFYPLKNVFLVDADPKQILDLGRSLGVDSIVVHTSPFYEMLPELARSFECWVWEYGDPTPALFPPDQAVRRQQVKDDKLVRCYPLARGVIAISNFIRQDIAFEAAQVVYLGCDHVPDLGTKASFETGAPLKVGTLMRLGKGEALYKGSALLRDFAAKLLARGVSVSLEVMGRGSPQDALEYEKLGFKVRLNASDEEKRLFLRELDLFVTFSEWEGFNLPLAEAQALGTLGCALDKGAHREVSPYVFSDVNAAVDLVSRFASDREELAKASKTSYEFVRSRFTWAAAARRFIALVEGKKAEAGSAVAASLTWGERLKAASTLLCRPKIALHVLRKRCGL